VLAGGESDLPLAALALRVLATLVRTAPASAPGVADKVGPHQGATCASLEYPP
jgi:hypothetical protein